MAIYENGNLFETRILPVNMSDLGRFDDPETLEHWVLPTDPTSLKPLQVAADRLKSSNVPVGFPTETVYGLGADATRSDAVKGIYKAKNRPSDNPLISHVSDLTMLRSLISDHSLPNGNTNGFADPIPEIYKPLIKNFWPGPLTIIVPNPRLSKLAPEVTAGLPSFGVRMPRSPLALSLIHLAGVPLAAPSANASTKPSPTTAQHVKFDLDGKIEFILDGGPCHVGVESTVVDGICSPPVVLRPGGVSIDCIRKCKGWGNVEKAYKDASEIGTTAPRAPGMKYKHYSPKATVVLFEASSEREYKNAISLEFRRSIVTGRGKLAHLGFSILGREPRIGLISTKSWENWAGLDAGRHDDLDSQTFVDEEERLATAGNFSMRQGRLRCDHLECYNSRTITLVEISLGNENQNIAHGIFSALRALDQRHVDIIFVEGIKDEGDIAAAVMNRLRKAASMIES